MQGLATRSDGGRALCGEDGVGEVKTKARKNTQQSARSRAAPRSNGLARSRRLSEDCREGR